MAIESLTVRHTVMDSGEVTRKLSQAAKDRDQCLDILPAHHMTWAFIADAGANRHRVMRLEGELW
jgi:hypothetical protein